MCQYDHAVFKSLLFVADATLLNLLQARFLPDPPAVYERHKNFFGKSHGFIFPRKSPARSVSTGCCAALLAAFGASQACNQASKSRFSRREQKDCGLSRNACI